MKAGGKFGVKPRRIEYESVLLAPSLKSCFCVCVPEMEYCFYHSQGLHNKGFFFKSVMLNKSSNN